SLRPLLVGDHIYKNQDASTVAELLIRYWKAIGELWPDAIKDDSRDDYNLMKSLGILTMHNIAATIFEAARIGGGKITQEAIVKVLRPVVAKVGPDFWATDGESGKIGTNNKAVRYASDKILKHIQRGSLGTSLL